MSDDNHYFRRFLARLFDFMFIEILVLGSKQLNPHSIPDNPVIWFLIYNLIVALARGRTLGKYCMDLSIHHKHRQGRFRLICRECLFLLLFPFLLLNVVCGAKAPLHDRICKTKVKRYEF